MGVIDGNNSRNSNMFVDLYDQLSHRCHPAQVGWAPVIGPCTVRRTVAVGPGLYPKEGSRCRAYTHKCSRLSTFFPRELQGGAMNESEDRRKRSVTEENFFLKLWVQLLTKLVLKHPISH